MQVVWSVMLAVQLLQVPTPSFTTYTIRPGDTLGALYRLPARIEFVARYNGLEPRRLKINRVILVPVDWSACQGYAPLPTPVDSLRSWDQCTVVDLSEQCLGGYERGQLVQYCRVSTGRPGHETPVGSFEILGHDLDHTSNLYETSDGLPFPMPYAVRFASDKWIHEGDLPGQPASHGCIRLRCTDAKWFYTWAQTGSSVFIVP